MAIGMGRRNPKGEMIPMSTKAGDNRLGATYESWEGG